MRRGGTTPDNNGQQKPEQGSNRTHLERQRDPSGRQLYFDGIRVRSRDNGDRGQCEQEE